MRNALLVRAAQGGEEKVLLREAGYPDSWSRDGKWLAYGAPRLGHYDLFAVALPCSDDRLVSRWRGRRSGRAASRRGASRSRGC
jgi:Tol biopolymer transport system component